MKITKIDSLPVREKEKLSNSSNISGDNFSVCLEGALEKQQIEGDVKMGRIQETISLFCQENLPINRSMADTPSTVKLSIDRLEIFAKLLNSLDFDPKQIELVADEMAKAATENYEESLPVEEEVRMFSFLESVKWKRGDYL
ncbi:MAG: hypothetical protein N2260_02405 [Syntrophobacterales bacterium]|nr:hypothetical protein [Syntrophobacterales bacterium]